MLCDPSRHVIITLDCLLDRASVCSACRLCSLEDNPRQRPFLVRVNILLNRISRRHTFDACRLLDNVGHGVELVAYDLVVLVWECVFGLAGEVVS